MTRTDLPRPDQANPQIQEYLKAFRKGLASRWVVPGKQKGWYVNRPDGSGKSLFATKKQAVETAEQELVKTKGELFIFDQAGEVTCRYFPAATK